MQIDEVALDALLPPSVLPAVRHLDSDVAMEVIFEDDDMADAAATRQFNRFSSPYERIELSEVAPLPQRRTRPTTFARTIVAKGTPIAGVPSLASDTLRIPAVVEARPTVKLDAVLPPVEMPTVEVPAPRTKTASIVRRATLQNAVQASATVPFERVWFDEEELAAMLEEPAAEPKTSWWWLAISLAAGAAAVAWMASLA